jgi:putative glutamine amidotransferase
LNVGTGGTLIQDIWSEVYGKTYLEEVVQMGRDNWHTNPLARLYPQEKLMGYNLHPIEFVKNSKFVTVLKFQTEDHPTIMSAHHQAVKTLGKGMKIAATTMDGKIVEAIEHEKYPQVLGLQFHPEFPMLYDKNGKHRITMDDEEKSIPTIFQENPPSYEFHEAIWSWFVENINKYNKNH